MAEQFKSNSLHWKNIFHVQNYYNEHYFQDLAFTETELTNYGNYINAIR